MPVFGVLNAGEPVDGLVHFYHSGKARVSASSGTVNCSEQTCSWTGHQQGEGSDRPDTRRGEL